MAPNFGPIKDPGPVPPLLRPGKGVPEALGEEQDHRRGKHAGAPETVAGDSDVPPVARPGSAEAEVAGEGDEPAAASEERTSQPGAPVDRSAPVRMEATHRKAPRYGRFIFTGLLIGAVASFLLAIISRGWSGLTMANTFWLSLIALGTLGMFIGAGVALYLDRKSLAAMQRQQKER